MSIETALVFDQEGKTIHWHLPPGRSNGYIPDTRSLWEVLWENRHRLGGVAHTHPWEGDTWFSGTDVTTFSAVERALGQRLQWPIVTFTSVQVFVWVGPEKYDYGLLRSDPIPVEDVAELRQRSR